MKATAVIGAAFGDEGKGRTVDYLAQKVIAPPVVVRFNGGGQAGHTVEARSKRHVFSHFGSGTLAGSPTMLSRFFVVNSKVFVNEWVELHQKGFYPLVYIDPLCPLTTPYEVAVNRALERSRGECRHGSCGIGFGETVEREERGVSLSMWMLRLEAAREHAARRLEELGLPFAETLEAADQEVESWFDALAFMKRRTVLKDTVDVLKGFPEVIFEGAQGLLLDAGSKFFPHVTRSNTGLKNVMVLAKEAGIGDVQAVYVTRSYLTRHGAGPLPGENKLLAYPDKTNVHGEFQGSLRFAPLNLELLSDAIYDDTEAYSVDVALSVTCLDQHGGIMLAHQIEDYFGLPVTYASFGPDRDAMIERKGTVSVPPHLISALTDSM